MLIIENLKSIFFSLKNIPILLKKMNYILLCKKYGYFFVFIGAVLEGDIITISAGYTAYYKYFNIFYLILFIFSVTIIIDQLVFLLGKIYKNKIEEKLKNSSDNFFMKQIKKAYIYLNKYGNFIGIIFRFLPSIRLIIPFVLGNTNMNQKKFFFLNVISGILWVFTLCLGGYFCAYIFPYDTAVKIFTYLPWIGWSLTFFSLLKSILKK